MGKIRMIKPHVSSRIAEPFRIGLCSHRSFSMSKKSRYLNGVAMQSVDPVMFEALYQNAPDGIAALDRETRFLAANPAYLRMTNLTQAELLQTSCLELTAQEDRLRAEAVMEELLRVGYIERFEKTCVVNDGQRIIVSMSLTLLPDKQRILAITREITEKNRLQQAEQWQLSHDVLTGLPNQMLLSDRFARAIVRAQRNHSLLAVCIIDLDQFKPINQELGSYVGDCILIQAARRLSRVVRGDDTVARTGGDEFVLLIGNLFHQDELLDRINRALYELSRPFEVDGHQIELSASVGCALYPEHNDDADMLLRYAQHTLYLAKQEGRNRHKLFDASLDAAIQSTHQLIINVDAALQANELVLFYQPKVNMRSGEVFGMEALLRWQHPIKGMVPPLDFLPQVEQHDLIVVIGEWAIQQALTQIERWRNAGKIWHVSVNIAARHFQRSDFLSRLLVLLAPYPKAVHELLEIELLESVALGDVEQANQQMRAIQALGVSFALDDFGTGYSSLSYLKRLPTETIKIDRTFVRDILDDKNDLALIEAIIGMGRAFERTLVAEGVETVAQGLLLIRLGCERAQGYGIGKPMPADEVPGWSERFRVDPLWQKWAHVRWDMNDFPLLLAQYDHVEWVSRLVARIDHRQVVLSRAEVTDEHQCRFGRWYDTQGTARYQHLPEFHAMREPHRLVHECGSSLLAAIEQQDDASIPRLKERLLSLKEDMLAHIEALQFAFYAQ